MMKRKENLKWSSFLAIEATLMWNFFKKPSLSKDQIHFWNENGYLILENFIDADVVNAVNNEIDQLLDHRDRYPRVTVHVLSRNPNGELMNIADVPASDFEGPVKINDLFIDSDIVRSCNMKTELVGVLRKLLDGDPMIINSLNFIFGSEQGAHYDSWYMPPIVRDKMVVTSICLDAYTDENGPLFVYPGSHKIPPYVFPHGHIALLGADLKPAYDYVKETTKDIERVYFYGKPGDVLIWHSQLLHGGAPIANRSKKRRSLVTHYWRAQDVERERAIKLMRHGYMLKRDHLSTK